MQMHLLSMVCGYNLTFHKSQSRGELRHSRLKSRLGRPWLRHGPVSCLPSPFSFYSVPLSFPDRTGPSSNGRTSDFGSENGGSNPPGAIADDTDTCDDRRALPNSHLQLSAATMNETSGAGLYLAQPEPVQPATLSRGFRLISGTANRALSLEIAELLGVELC